MYKMMTTDPTTNLPEAASTPLIEDGPDSRGLDLAEAHGHLVPVMYCVDAGLDRAGDPLWSFYCDFCDRDHFHGAEAGHRSAHCADDDSPYKPFGYYLKHISEFKRGTQ